MIFGDVEILRIKWTNKTYKVVIYKVRGIRNDLNGKTGKTWNTHRKNVEEAGLFKCVIYTYFNF